MPTWQYQKLKTFDKENGRGIYKRLLVFQICYIVVLPFYTDVWFDSVVNLNSLAW